MKIKTQTIKKWALVMLIAFLCFFVYIFFIDSSNPIKDWFLEDFYNNFSDWFGQGLVTSLVATLIFTLIYQFVFGKNEKKLHENVEYLLGKLPDAIGGGFTKNLFEYHPSMSKAIAEYLSQNVQLSYKNNFERINVESAYDSYRIKRIVEWKGQSLWELEFITEWVWFNDSEMAKYPLRGFKIVLSAPVDSFYSFSRKFSRVSREKEKRVEKQVKEYYSNNNIIRSYIENPENPSEKLDIEDVNELFSIKSISFDDDNGFDKELFVECKDEKGQLKLSESLLDIPEALIYKEFLLHPEVADYKLEKGKKLAVKYSGVIKLPVFKENDKIIGKLDYPPSDIVSKEYSVLIQYPDVLPFGEREMKIEIMHDRSGLYDNSNDFLNLIGRRPKFDSGPLSFENSQDSEKAMQLHVSNHSKEHMPLSENKQMKCVWKAYSKN